MKVFVYEHLSAGAADEADAELLPQGLAMRDAMVADLAALADCAVSIAAPAPARGSARARHVHAAAGETAVQFVTRQAALHDLVWLVAPETGALLHQLACAVERARWLGCTPKAIALASSKRATLECLHANGIPTPLRFAAEPAQGWVVKPDDGAGALHTRRHPSFAAALAELRARQRAGALACLEPWIDGEPLSLSLACTAGGGCELLSVNRQHIAVDGDGGLRFDGVELDVMRSGDTRHATLAALAARVAAAIPGLHGFVGIDLVWHVRHGAVVIEVNPRLTSAYVGLSARLRRPLAAELIAAHHRHG